MALAQPTYLEDYPFFKGLPEHDLSELESSSNVVDFAKGEHIYQHGDNANNIYFLLEGKVKIGSFSDEGKEIIKSILNPGDLFGEFALLGEESRKNFAQALEKASIAVINSSMLRLMMLNNATLGMKITKLIGERLQRTEKRLESIIFKDARSRVIELLKEMAEERGQRVGYETLIWNYLTHNDMAGLTATSRQTVTTVLNELKDKNLIYFDRKRILIRDLENLN